MHLVAFRNNLIRRGQQLISLNDTGSQNEKILFSGGMGKDRPRSKHKNVNFNCATPESVSLSSLTRQLNFQNSGRGGGGV